MTIGTSGAGSGSRNWPASAASRSWPRWKRFPPDLARYVIEFGYGDIYSRPTLDDQARQLAAISALSAMGGAEPQLEYHIGIALNVGVPPGQIVETVLFLSPFVGFARTLNAVRSIKRVFASRKLL